MPVCAYLCVSLYTFLFVYKIYILFMVVIMCMVCFFSMCQSVCCVGFFFLLSFFSFPFPFFLNPRKECLLLLAKEFCQESATTMQIWGLTSLKCLRLFLSTIVLQCETLCQAAAGLTILLQGEPRCILFTFFLFCLSSYVNSVSQTRRQFVTLLQRSTEALESIVSLSLGNSA